jgi:transposase
VDDDVGDLPDDVAALKVALIASRAEAAAARAQLAEHEAVIAALKLQIEKYQRDRYGPRSERIARLLDQLELQLEEAESTATEDELAAEMAAAKTSHVTAFTRRRPVRKPFPAHLPRERVVVPGPTCCACCGGTRLCKLGEDTTETLEVILRQWKVIQYVREKFSCRDCEKISQAPAPFHVIPRGWAGPSLLAMIAFEKFGQHQPLNRQAERYAREGVPLSLSTLADQVGAVCTVMQPVFERIESHVFAAERLHGDDMTVPVLARGKTDTGRCWARCVMIGRSADQRRPPWSSTTRAIVAVSIRDGIWRDGLASCRPMPMAVTTRSTVPAEVLGQSVRPCAGATAGGSYSSWRTSPRPRVERHAARPPSSRRSLWRR